PRCSRSTSPASSSFLRWCETVGCASPSGSTSSHTHTGSPVVASRLTIRTRAGSASDLKSAAVAAASASSSTGAASGAQQATGVAAPAGTGVSARAVISINVNISTVRPSTILAAETILVCDRGRVVERGDHASLLGAGRRVRAPLRAADEAGSTSSGRPPPSRRRSPARRGGAPSLRTVLPPRRAPPPGPGARARSADDARRPAPHQPLDLRERGHRRVAGRRHRESAVRDAVGERPVDVRSGEEAVEEAGGEGVAAAAPVEDLEPGERRPHVEARPRPADGAPVVQGRGARLAQGRGGDRDALVLGEHLPEQVSVGGRVELEQLLVAAREL